ncbi:MAG TPA: MMPL family transporter [Anaeromyxobacteraceae bacterium]|nr:MMPL family transporter [Anaeromyxobacteraceae bacterium]
MNRGGQPAGEAGEGLQGAAPELGGPPAVSWSDRFVAFLVRQRRPVLLLAVLATVIGGYYTALLYGDLRSSVEELLPESAPSVVAARTLGPKLHNVTHLSIVFEGRDGDAIARLADDVVARLRKLPPGMVDSVEYRTDAQSEFMHRFGPLYLQVDDLKEIQRRIDARVAFEKKRANPLLDLLGENDPGPAPPLDFGDIEKKYESATGLLANFRNGYYQTPDGHILVILIHPPELSGGYEANKKLVQHVKAAVAEAKPARYDPTVRVGYDGEVSSLLEEQDALVADLASSTVVVIVFVLLALWLFYRRWRAIWAICAALLVGCALTFGLAYFLIGHLNANTAFLGSIVLGNGINVSIIIVARYLEERRLGIPILPAIQTAWRGTLAATFVASFGAGLAYLSLSVTSFRGFSQFGLIGGVGMALCWLTAYLLLPPLLAAIDGRHPDELPRKAPGYLGRAAAMLVERHGRAIRWGAVVLLLAAAGGVLSYRGDLIEYDLSKLRAARSAENGAIYWGGKVDQVFKAYLTPTVVRAETPAELDRVVATIEQSRKALGAADPIREIRTLRNVLPDRQAEKLPLLATLRRSLSDRRLSQLEPEQRRRILEIRPRSDLRAVKVSDLPSSVSIPMTERDGTAGKVALVFPRVVGTLGPKELAEITDLIRGSIQRSGARAQAVGESLLFNDIAGAIWSDGPRATFAALALVCLLATIVFGKLRPSLWTIASLLLGVGWLLGAAAAARVRLNFLNFVVLPITFGIGIDYAVNIVQRWRLEGEGSMCRALRETGGAVALCSATTIIGYASLLVADNRALRGFGLLASVGEVACLTAALLVLPAWIDRRMGCKPGE